MAKKSTKENKMEPETKAYCQFCKYHSNSPSYCKNLEKYIGRKEKACKNFKGKDK